MDPTYFIKENKQAYRDFLHQEKVVPIFYHPDWWNNVPGVDKWTPLCLFQDQKIIGICPMFYRRKWFLNKATNPFITPFTGPWLPGNTPSVILKEALLFTYTFIKKKSLFIHLKLDPSISLNQQEIYNAPGFRTRSIQHFPLSKKDTFRIAPSLQKDIESCYSSLTFAREEELNTSFNLIESHLKLKGNPLPFKFKDFLLLDQNLKKSNRRTILTARTKDGKLAGIHYVVKDEVAHYALLSGINRSLAPRGCHAALRQMAKDEALKAQKDYDLCGSSIPSIAKANRALGAIDRDQIILSTR